MNTIAIRRNKINTKEFHLKIDEIENEQAIEKNWFFHNINKITF